MCNAMYCASITKYEGKSLRLIDLLSIHREKVRLVVVVVVISPKSVD